MKTTKPTHRRKFLLAAGLGGAGVAAAVVTGAHTAKEAAPVVEASEKSTTTAYRASPHVLKYYKTTEV
jgi:nitrous oxide reductase